MVTVVTCSTNGYKRGNAYWHKNCQKAKSVTSAVWTQTSKLAAHVQTTESKAHKGVCERKKQTNKEYYITTILNKNYYLRAKDPRYSKYFLNNYTATYFSLGNIDVH